MLRGTLQPWKNQSGPDLASRAVPIFLAGCMSCIPNIIIECIGQGGRLKKAGRTRQSCQHVSSFLTGARSQPIKTGRDMAASCSWWATVRLWTLRGLGGGCILVTCYEGPATYARDLVALCRACTDLVRPVYRNLNHCLISRFCPLLHFLPLPSSC
jgi:hypothetical protein